MSWHGWRSGAQLQVKVAAAVEPSRLGGDAQRAWQECRNAGVAIQAFDPALLSRSM